MLTGPTLKQRHFLNVIKYLGNELQIPIVGVGTRDAFNAIHTDPQLANRFKPELLGRLSPRAGLETRGETVGAKILSLSEGTIGEISALLARAALHAIESGIEQLTSDVFDRCG